MKVKTCKNPECRKKYQPLRPLQQVCSAYCASVLTRKVKEKAWRKEKAQIKKSLMTHKDWVNALVPVFNKYIRARDAKKPCISCGKPLPEKYDAGHCFPAGHYANIRFHEDNVHAQCIECNQHKHGNQAEYLLRLPERIGQSSFERLLEARNQSTKYSIAELQEMIQRYKKKAKDLE